MFIGTFCMGKLPVEIKKEKLLRMKSRFALAAGEGEARLPRLAADELMMLVKILNLSSESCSSGDANRKVMNIKT